MEEGCYPYFQAISGSDAAAEVIIDGRRMIMIGSNNYLGLTHHPKVIEAVMEATVRYGSGCTGSRFLNGTLDIHVELEERLARFMKKEAALTFSTGFQTNLGVIASLVGKDEKIYCDRENHASVIEGCRLSFGETRKFRHGDMDDLERLMSVDGNNNRGKLIVVDGVYSMFGDIVDLPKIVDLSSRYGVRMMVDDAHGIGVLGDHGRGVAEHFGLEEEVDIIMGTFSKSFASMGGFIVGPEPVLHYIKHHSRTHIFSASMSPSNTAAVLAALEIIENEPEHREQLWKNAEKMRRRFQSLGFDTGDSQTPIIPIIVGDQLRTFQFWRELFDRGIFTNAVTSPAVPPEKDLIRTSYMPAHTEDQLNHVLDVFETVGKRMGLI